VCAIATESFCKKNISFGRSAIINNICQAVEKMAIEKFLQNFNNPIQLLGNKLFLDKNGAQFSNYDQRADKLYMSHSFGLACNCHKAKYSILGESSSCFICMEKHIVRCKSEEPYNGTH
jgi:hypothetical protein